MFSFYQYFSNYHNVYPAILLIACIGVLISSLEYLVIHKEFKTDGVFSWKIFSSRPDYINNARLLKKIDFLFGYTSFIVIHILRVLCCIVLPFVESYPMMALLVSVIAVSSLIFSYRNIIGTDGSDQMNSVIFITFFITFLANDEFVFKTGLIFIACQSIMSYVIAGIAKIRGPKWRKGAAVFQIMNTKKLLVQAEPRHHWHFLVHLQNKIDIILLRSNMKYQ